jgi:dipeptidyl aminopeptidase/acylaminoacyl peptidase
MTVLRATFLALLVTPLALTAQQPARHTITHEDLFLMKRVGAPAVSPDGRWAAFSVTEPSYAENEQVTDLWIAPTDGGAPPRRLTATRSGEGGAAWSPDGRRIAFSARREGDEASQIYVLDLAQGGEAQRVTSVSTGARAPRWRPDGRALLFTSDVYPGAVTDSANRAAAAERRARRYNARVFDGFPIRDWDRWLDDPRRATLMVQELTPGNAARDLLAGTQLARMPGFGGQTGQGSENISAVWTPDGQGIVFVATTNRHEAAFAEVVHSLWLVSASGGEPRLLTDARGDFGSPMFRPDGRALYARMTPNTQHTYNRSRLVMWAWPNPPAHPQVLTERWDKVPGSVVFSDDSRWVYITSEDAGLERLYRMPAGGGEVREVGTLDAGVITGLDFAEQAPVLIGSWGSAVSPAEVHRFDPATGARTALTRFNADRVARLNWQPVRHVWFTSSRGRRIHSIMVLPPDFDSTRSYPLFVLIHGGPHNMWRDDITYRWNYHLLGAPGYVMLLTNYTGSTGFGERFAQNIQFDPLETPGTEINEAADDVIRRFRFVDRSRQVAGGASYGGHLANWLAVTTTRYRALVSHAGLWDLETQWATSDVIFDRERNIGGPPWENIPLWRDQSPMRRAANLRTPMLVSVGERDFRVPMNNALELWSALQRQRVPSRLIVWPAENHWILNGENSRFFYREVHAWVARWLEAGGQPAGN